MLFSDKGGSMVLQNVGTCQPDYIPEEYSLNIHCCENLKSHTLVIPLPCLNDNLRGEEVTRNVEDSLQWQCIYITWTDDIFTHGQV
jgi:hypothetical protein